MLVLRPGLLRSRFPILFVRPSAESQGRIQSCLDRGHIRTTEKRYELGITAGFNHVGPPWLRWIAAAMLRPLQAMFEALSPAESAAVRAANVDDIDEIKMQYYKEQSLPNPPAEPAT